jgi:hypothetical protein
MLLEWITILVSKTNPNKTLKFFSHKTNSKFEIYTLTVLNKRVKNYNKRKNNKINFVFKITNHKYYKYFQGWYYCILIEEFWD